MNSLLLSIGEGSSILHLKTPSLTTTLKPSIKSPPPSLSFPSRTISKSISFNPQTGSHIRVRASSKSSPKNGSSSPNRILQTAAAASIVLAAAVATKFHQFPARAETTPAAVSEEKLDQHHPEEEEKLDQNQEQEAKNSKYQSTPLSKFLVSNSESVEAGKDQEAPEMVKKVALAQEEEMEWKFLMARTLNEMGSTQDARDMFEEIIKLHPLNFEALFENALLMDRCGEGNAVILRLDEMLKIAEENEVKGARYVRLIMAQIQFLMKNVDEALRCYEELGREDPNDCRPYFCKGMIYSLLDRNKEAKEEFAKYRQLLPVSRMKIVGTTQKN